MFKPDPIDTKDIVLSPELQELTEKIAQSVHNVWAKNRINEGWKYGKNRDDVKKETPCLVPYEDLPEEEKDYDRNTALETLTVIISLGYKIEK